MLSKTRQPRKQQSCNPQINSLRRILCTKYLQTLPAWQVSRRPLLICRPRVTLPHITNSNIFLSASLCTSDHFLLFISQGGQSRTSLQSKTSTGFLFL